jgi:Flp pilus assembly protein TadB
MSKKKTEKTARKPARRNYNLILSGLLILLAVALYFFSPVLTLILLPAVPWCVIRSLRRQRLDHMRTLLLARSY